MFVKNKDEVTQKFFELGDSNFNMFVEYIIEKNALPISLSATKELL